MSHVETYAQPALSKPIRLLEMSAYHNQCSAEGRGPGAKHLYKLNAEGLFANIVGAVAFWQEFFFDIVLWCLWLATWVLDKQQACTYSGRDLEDERLAGKRK